MSKKDVNQLIQEAQQKMNGYAMLYYFHLGNLCIKADPMALLSATVEINGNELNLENVARVSLPKEDQFAVIPNEKEYVFPVCKAIKFTHPEFEMEEKIERNQLTDEEETVIYYTMPTVNEDRRDVCMDYIKMKYEAATLNIETVFSMHTAKIMALLTGASVESINMVKENLQEIYDWHTNLCNQLREDKEKEVEEAYQKYLATVTEQQKQTEEQEAAQGTDTLFTMNMNDEE